jgi:hypothetical protein
MNFKLELFSPSDKALVECWKSAFFGGLPVSVDTTFFQGDVHVIGYSEGMSDVRIDGKPQLSHVFEMRPVKTCLSCGKPAEVVVQDIDRDYEAEKDSNNGWKQFRPGLKAAYCSEHAPGAGGVIE